MRRKKKLDCKSQGGSSWKEGKSKWQAKSISSHTPTTVTCREIIIIIRERQRQREMKERERESGTCNTHDLKMEQKEIRGKKKFEREREI